MLRCEHCPVNRLEAERAHSAAGRLFERILELEFACKHFAVSWGDVRAEEAQGLQILEAEREKYRAEQSQDVEKVTAEESRQLQLMQKYMKR